MRIPDLISQFDEIGLRDFPPRVQMRIMLRVLAEQLSEIRLPPNMPIRDAGDFRALLLLVADGLDRPKVSKRVDLDLVCPTCGHRHELAGECGVSMGGAGVCDCKAEVRV